MAVPYRSFPEHKDSRCLLYTSNFDKQRGAYKVILKNRFVVLKNGMHPVVEQIVLWHEIGHDVLHRQEAVAVGGIKEFNIFDLRENRMEYEANIGIEVPFAGLLLP